MNEETKKIVAMFRFGVIAEFVNGRVFLHGEKERLLDEKCANKWIIPGSTRTRISRSVLKSWISAYRKSNGQLESLFPKGRNDKGGCRAIADEILAGLIKLRKELPEKPMPVLLREARQRGIIPVGTFLASQTVYRLLRPYSGRPEIMPTDRRKFEAEQVNDLWQSDVMHGPMVNAGNRQQKAYLIAIIDDMSRFVVHAEFYLSEQLDNYLAALRKALLSRGIPRKLYVDNGPAFRSHQLEYACAGLGITLIHAKPYQPEGKGKIERWFKTVRESFLAGLKGSLTLEELNRELALWLDEYQHKEHSTTKESPRARFTRNISAIRIAPDNLERYFRKVARRTVRNDRTVALSDKLYEAPVALIGKQVQLLFQPHDPELIEIMFQEKTYGYLKLVDANVNYRVSRANKGRTELIVNPDNSYSGGNLFETKGDSDHAEL
jgi:transposase InsO family protein